MPKYTIPILEELPKWKVLKAIIYEIFEEIDPFKKMVKKEGIKVEVGDDEKDEIKKKLDKEEIEKEEDEKLRSIRNRYKEFKDPSKYKSKYKKKKIIIIIIIINK